MKKNTITVKQLIDIVRNPSSSKRSGLFHPDTPESVRKKTIKKLKQIIQNSFASAATKDDIGPLTKLLMRGLPAKLEVDGLAELIDEDASFGQRTRAQRSDFGKRGVKTAKDNASEWQRQVLQCAQALRKKHPNRTVYTTHRIASVVYEKIGSELPVKKQSVYKYLRRQFRM